jgi:hypothetical protein
MRLIGFLPRFSLATPQSRKMLSRINQETGAAIVLFRRDFARVGKATADDLIIRQTMIHTKLIWCGTPAMQCFLRDQLKTWE